jgi:hypothetical protein
VITDAYLKAIIDKATGMTELHATLLSSLEKCQVQYIIEFFIDRLCDKPVRGLVNLFYISKISCYYKLPGFLLYDTKLRIVVTIIGTISMPSKLLTDSTFYTYDDH